MPAASGDPERDHGPDNDARRNDASITDARAESLRSISA
jgi:hypothetical protein